MKLFTDCSGECCVCACDGGCLAGHGDDDFILASKEDILYNLLHGKYPHYVDHMKKTLLKEYGYDYDKEIPMKIHEDVIIPEFNAKGFICSIELPNVLNNGRFYVEYKDNDDITHDRAFDFKDYGTKVIHYEDK